MKTKPAEIMIEFKLKGVEYTVMCRSYQYYEETKNHDFFFETDSLIITLKGIKVTNVFSCKSSQIDEGFTENLLQKLPALNIKNDEYKNLFQYSWRE